MNKSSRIYIAGHTGLVGSAILRHLTKEGYTNILTRTRDKLNLLNGKQVNNFFWDEKPEYVFMAAAKVGGVAANIAYPAEFLHENLVIQSNIIHSAYKFETKKLLFLASNCIYPKLAAQPLKEEYLHAGKLEPSTEPYAIAKLAGIRMCQAYRDQYGCNFISAIPVNLYGPNDRYHPENAHVISALMTKFIEARNSGAEKVQVWGSGVARREFLHSDDLAGACVFLMDRYDERDPINVGPQSDINIEHLAIIIASVVGFSGGIELDHSKPDGILSKVLETSKINLIGWEPKIALREGLEMVYKSMTE